MVRTFFMFSLMASLVTTALAVNPREILDDPALEARAREISKGLRCVVCQNQSIDDSDAVLARDLRILVRERLTAGDSDTQVVNYIASRYGDFVLLNPPFKIGTLVLWLGPFIILIIASLAGVVFFRHQRSALKYEKLSLPLNSQERENLDNLLKD